MKLTYKSTGLGIVAVAVLMLGSAAIADQMGSMGHGAMMGGPVMDLTTMDADKDGKVSKDEMTAHRAARTAAVDANADGKLSADELAAMHLATMEAAAKNMAARMIEQLDTDADGLLSVAELAARPGPEMMFDRIDANSDGFIDQAEVDDRIFHAVRLVEAALGQATIERHLTAFVAADGDARTRFLALDPAACGLALARTRTTRHALLLFGGAGIVGKLVQFHVAYSISRNAHTCDGCGQRGVSF